MPQAAKQICDVMDSMQYQYIWYKAFNLVQIQFKRSQSENFDINDTFYSGLPMMEKVDEIRKNCTKLAH